MTKIGENFKRLNHVQLTLPAGAEDAARAFYGKLLGFQEINKPEPLKSRGGLWFQTADIQLHLGIESFQGESKRHPAFEVENLESIKAYLQSNNIRVRDEIKIPGVERLSFFDPFGNRIELMEFDSDSNR